jgi:hypothetical protein
MVIRLDIKIYIIGKDGPIKGEGKQVVEWGMRYGGCWVLWSLCVFECISVVVEGTCVSDYRILGLYTV